MEVQLMLSFSLSTNCLYVSHSLPLSFSNQYVAILTLNN